MLSVSTPWSNALNTKIQPRLREFAPQYPKSTPPQRLPKMFIASPGSQATRTKIQKAPAKAELLLARPRGTGAGQG